MSEKSELISLTYCSTATFQAARGSYGVHPEVNRILLQSRRNNRKREVGGMLHFGNGRFFQYLEGEADVVDRLFARIRDDDRHWDVRQLTRSALADRRFADWSMKFVVLEQVVAEVLDRAGLQTFDPYEFTPSIIEDLLQASIRSPEGAPDSASSPASEPARTGVGKRSIIQRLFRR